MNVSRIACAAAVLAVIASPVLAFAPGGPTKVGYEVPLPLSMSSPVYTHPDAQAAAALLPALVDFQRGEGDRWFLAGWRPDLATPAALMGPGIDIVPAEAGDAAIRDAAERFVDAHSALLGVDTRTLARPEILWMGEGKCVVSFQQVYEGLEVVGGRAELALEQGKVVLIGSECFPAVSLPTAPALTSEDARLASVAGLDVFGPADQFEGTPRLVVYPLILDGTAQYFLAWEVKLRTERPNGWWWVYVDAADGEILSRVNHAPPLDIPTTVDVDAHPKTLTDPLVASPGENEKVRANNTDFYTDEAGFVNLTVPNQQSYTVTTDLSGNYANVNNYSGADASISTSGTPGTPLSIHWTTSNATDAERDGFVHTNVVHDWIKALDPAFTGTDYAMGCWVNRTDGTCNAYWNGSSINFYAAGGGCSNTATIADIIYHEYGHGITQFTYSPSAPPTASGMGEGFSDIVANNMQDEPVLGEGWHNGTGFVRTGLNLRQYPGTECAGEVHCLGEIVMGAMWKARANLEVTHGTAAGGAIHDALFRSAWKTKQNTMPNFLTKVLVADDDNADLSDGTPNFYDICDAFTLHNLPCPAITKYIQFTHTPLDDQSDIASPYAVTSLVQSVSAGNLLAASIQVNYSSDGGLNWASALMSPTGNPNEYRGYIPAQGCGTLVQYYLSASTDLGIDGTEPSRAPSHGVHRFMVGASITSLNDTFESNLGWTIGAPGDAAIDGIWQRVDPTGKTNPSTSEVVQPEDDHTNPGTICFVTDGSGGYFANHDVDAGATTILSPTFNWGTGPGVAKFDGWLFFANETPVDDTLRVSVSNDNGATWTDLIKVYGGDANAWNQYQKYFTSDDVAFTSQMRFRIQASDFNASLVEAAADDILIRYVPCTSTGVDQGGLPVRFAVSQNQPNPFRGSTEIRYALPTAGRVSIEVFDAGGRLVRTLENANRAAGYHTVRWNGRDDSGREAASGLYFYRVTSPAGESTRKMLVLE